MAIFSPAPHAPPDAWTAAMREFDFARAWAITDADFARGRDPAEKHRGPRHLQRIWWGEPLAGRHVLVRCYHGLGDTIQYARFLPRLRERAARVTVWMQPQLVALFRGFPGIDTLLPLHDGDPGLDYDVDIEIMELAHALRASRADIEALGPYLSAASRRSPDAPCGDQITVGLNWRAGDWDDRRTIPPAALAPLLALSSADPRLRLQSLGPSDIPAIPHAPGVSPTCPIENLAAVMSRLDLIITVDSMTAHLAGALGRRAWVLLPAPADWRWGIGTSTPWYPQLRLYRQCAPHDWSDVVDTVAAALAQQLPVVDRVG